jgi:hypothetical protein
VALTGLALLLNAGCGGGSTGESVAAATAAPTPTASATQPSPSPVASSAAPVARDPAGSSGSVEAHITTPNKYTLDYNVSITLGAATADTANATPGHTDLTVPVTLTSNVQDITPGHDSPAGESGVVELDALFPKTSAVCKETENAAVQTYYSGAGNAPPKYCSVGIGYDNGEGEMTSGMTYTSNMLLACKVNGLHCTQDDGTVGNLTFSDVDEAQAQQMAAELTAGPRYWVLTNGNDKCQDFSYSYADIVSSSPDGLTGCAE